MEDCKGSCTELDMWMIISDVDTNGEFVTLKPLNGATLYYTVAGASEKPMTQLEEPTFDSEQLKPGQKVVF